MAAASESYLSLVVFPLAVAIPFGVALFAMIRPPKLQRLAIATNALFLGAVVLLVLPVFALYGVLNHVLARVVEGNAAWIFTAVGWTLFIAISSSNVVHFINRRRLGASSATP